MTPKEKAAEVWVNENLNFEIYTDEERADAYEYFLAGCTYQEQVDREVIEKLVRFVELIAKIDVSEKEPDFLWLNEWRNYRKQLAMSTLDFYHKATGKVEGSGG